MDFTLTKYQELLSALLGQGYSFQTLEQFINNPLEKVVVLRHDVDRLPGNALKMARLEHGMGIQATYYFRSVSESFDPKIMEGIAGMGHEIGYHYENVESVVSDHWSVGEKQSAWRKAVSVKRKVERENIIDLGYEDFCRNLDRFRKKFDVQTICMHGSPLSSYDNRLIWEKYDYKKLGIIAEPYFDIDYKKVFYITDTGRKWNDKISSVRDRVESGLDIPIKNTKHLIEMVCQNNLPAKIMINVHPQRWHDHAWPWVKELVGQNVKNVVKKFIVRKQ